MVGLFCGKKMTEKSVFEPIYDTFTFWKKREL